MKKLSLVFAVAAAMAAWGETPKNVILFIGDGMSTPQRMTAEEFSLASRGRGLELNHLPVQAMTRTASATSLVTDSAAAATAIACGEKTYNGAVGVDKDGKRIESCAEAARDAGKKVGIVTSVTMNHATPSGFYAHRAQRSMLYEIGLDLIASGFDFFAGGGMDGKANNEESKEYQGNLYEIAATNGYTVACGKEEFASLHPGMGKIWYRDGEKAIGWAIDGPREEGQPRLPDLTRLAIECLDSEEGFFLMVEGGAVDWAGHANEAAVNLRDLLELEDAVNVALAYRNSHPDTLVVVTGDHETGGMSMGFAGTGYAFYMDRLANQTRSTDAFKKLVKYEKDGGTWDGAKALLEESYGFKFEGDEKADPMVLTEKERTRLANSFKEERLPDTARRIISEKAGVGWTSGSHTALPVLTTSIGPGSERFSGLLDNTDISKIIKSFYR